MIMTDRKKGAEGFHVDSAFFVVRDQRVILDADLSKIYGIPTFGFNEAVKRNRDRFPEKLLSQPTKQDRDALTSQFAISTPAPVHARFLNTPRIAPLCSEISYRTPRSTPTPPAFGGKGQEPNAKNQPISKPLRRVPPCSESSRPASESTPIPRRSSPH